jgi:phage tail protein X
MSTYTTVLGDTWDSIAYKVYGDDHAFEKLIDANPDYLGTLIFSASIVLNIPENGETENYTETEQTDAGIWREQMA